MRRKNSKISKPHFFVTGTDTGAGKTVVCAALARCLMAGGKTVSMVKPFQTGCAAGEVSDADFVHRVMGKKFEPQISSPCRLKEPLSPFAAAELEGRKFDMPEIFELIEKETQRYDAVIVEGAGGLLVPIMKNYFMADFALDLGFRTVIAARAGLGTINHTLLTVEAAKARNLQTEGVVICGYPLRRSVCEETNLLFLRSGTQGGKIVGIIPFIPGLKVEGGAAGALAEKDCRLFFTPALGGLLDEKEPENKQKTPI